MEFSRPFLNRLLLRRSAVFDKRLSEFKQGHRKIHAKDQDGNTLLHVAILENRLEYLEDLISYGLSPESENNWGMTPLDFAHFLGRQEFLPLLRAYREVAPITIYRNSDQMRHTISLKEFEQKLGIEYIEYLEFEHPDYLRWVATKSQKQLKKSTARKINRWTLALHKKAILTPRYDHIYIRYVSSEIGYGVFANRDLPALTYVGEYTGVVTRRQAKKTRFNDYVFGYMTGPKNCPFIIDAKRKSNFTRFINHSDEPNMNSRWVIVGGITRIILFTNEFIPKGEQLTYDYGKYYWRSRSAPALI
ncbi:MAG: SET domain-containing protein-lysine N-methyltransferase [Simkania sp.]|nr:SET domain-containing protein-lysine N-methyltransferase [Simkania sp.]